MVDLKAARDLGIWISNVPTDGSGNADSVAELGIYLMLGLAPNFNGMTRSLANQKMAFDNFLGRIKNEDEIFCRHGV